MGQQTQALIQKLKDIESLAKQETKTYKELQEKIWKDIRLTLMEIERLKEWEGQYKSFEQFLRTHFDSITRYTSQVTAARIEKLLGLPVATYPAYKLVELHQFQVYKPMGANQYGSRPNPSGIKLLRECWDIVLSLASSNPPTNKEVDECLEAAIWRMHKASPDVVKPPRGNHPKKVVEFKLATVEKELAEERKLRRRFENESALLSQQLRDLEVRLSAAQAALKASEQRIQNLISRNNLMYLQMHPEAERTAKAV